MSKWKLQRFRVEMAEPVTCRRRKKRRETGWSTSYRRWFRSRFRGENNGAMYCRGWERGWSYTPGNVSHCWIRKASRRRLTNWQLTTTWNLIPLVVKKYRRDYHTFQVRFDGDKRIVVLLIITLFLSMYYENFYRLSNF